MNKLAYKNNSYTIYSKWRQMDHFSTMYVNNNGIFNKVCSVLLNDMMKN